MISFPECQKWLKVAALNSLKGQVMKLSKGKANPALVGEILERKLKG
jgi:aspartyl-tRNA(Asn)/glutamyl-tRNA(Gln) amidotransferase subunit B